MAMTARSFVAVSSSTHACIAGMATSSIRDQSPCPEPGSVFGQRVFSNIVNARSTTLSRTARIVHRCPQIVIIAYQDGSDKEQCGCSFFRSCLECGHVYNQHFYGRGGKRKCLWGPNYERWPVNANYKVIKG